MCANMKELQKVSEKSLDWSRRNPKRKKVKMDYLETTPPGDPSHNQPPNQDTIAYASKILLKGP